jgi:hypothetical protein
MKRLLIVAGAAILLTTSAHAGSNTCQGLIHIGHPWSIINQDELRKLNPGDVVEDCRFLTDSKIGKHILSICNEGQFCNVERELGDKGPIIHKLIPGGHGYDPVEVSEDYQTKTAEQPMQVTFQQLPKEIRDHAISVRKSCMEVEDSARQMREQENANRAHYDMLGIEVIDLNGDGHQDLVVDDEQICGPDVRVAGVNCTNRDCHMSIWKETAKRQWRKIFDEHLNSKYMALDHDNPQAPRFQLMVASIWAGDKRCDNPPKEYTSGQSCNVIVTYRGNNWNWQRIK